MEYPPETRAAAVAALASGQSLHSVAKQFGISRPTVTAWRDQAHLPAVMPQKKQAIGEQIYGLLEDSIETLRIQVRVMRDEEWIKKQSADSLAILHGVVHDKTARLVAAFRPTAADGEDT